MHPSPRDPATRVRVPAGEPGDPPTTQIERPVRAETELLLALGELARLGERPESPAAVAERALEILVRRFTARTGVAGRIGQEGMEILASIGGPPELVTLARSVRLDESGVLEELFRTHAATLIDLSDPDLPRPELARATAALIGRWLLVIPMTSGVRTRGLLALSWTEEPRLAIDSALFADVGRIVAIALDNAFLRMEMDREIERRSRLEQSALVASIVVDRATEAIVLTDLDFRVRLWSPGAERLYGIPAELALGRHVDELRASSDLDGNPLPARLTPEFLDQGIWRGRIVHRPLLGDAAGRERLVDAVVTVLRDETNRPVALLAVNREVTPTARLEVELATLGSLAVETGRTADPQQIADSALEILTRATGATAALVLFYRGDGYETIARRGLSEETAVLITSFRRIGTRIGQALEDASAIVAADIHEAPLRPEIAAALEADGVGHVLLVGLRIGGELLGLLGLGWPSRPIALPSSPVILQAAALLAGTLENARLVRRLERSVEAEQRLSARLEALVDLTRLPEEASSETIARFLLEQTVGTVGAAAGIVAVVEGDRFRTVAAYGLALGWERMRTDRPVAGWTFARRFLAGEGAFVQPLVPGAASDETLRIARAVGYTAYAAFPIRHEGDLVAAVVLFFAQPADEILLDARTLGAIERLIGVAFANQRLRERLVASEERYRTLFVDHPEPLVVADSNGRIVDANRALAELTGRPLDALIGRDTAELVGVSASDLARHGTADGRARPTVRSELVRAGGPTVPVEVQVAPVRIGTEERLLVLIRDVTERERLQQELVQAQKMEAIGMLVSGVAHELNNPLAAIIAFSQLIRRDARLPEDIRHDADLLVQEADRTRRIVQNLLDFARQRPPERHPTRLEPLIRSVLELQSYAIDAARISIELEVPDDLPPLPLDRAQMQQVLLNLTLNAIQSIGSTRRGGTIRIRAERGRRGPDATVRIVVEDDGPGVPPEYRSRLFLPFFTTKPPGEGTGLGLSVSFGIVAGHGGRLSFEPGPGGRGSRFIIELPVEPVTATPREARPPEPSGAAFEAVAPAPSRGRVLVLDDELAIRAFLAKALRTAGFDPIVTATGEEAAAALQDGAISAFLCDYRMAGYSGREVYEQVVARRPELARRFVFMSGDVLNPELREFAERHGIDVLAKPFDLETVTRVVREVVARTERTPDG